MMKIYGYITIAIGLMCGLTSCEMREEIKGTNKTNTEKGMLQVDVKAENPVSTKAAVATDDFPIEIRGAEEANADESHSYPSPSDFPEEGLLLPVGKYTVSAHSNLTLEKEMSVTYFEGAEEVAIATQVKTQSVVDCKIKNTKIEIVLDPEFSAALSEWKLTIDDGSGTVLDFSSTTTKRLVYWFFGEEVDKLSLNIRGKLLEGGNTITENMTLTKSQATEKYDDVSEFFEGGEALKITLKLTEVENGSVSLGVAANILFTNHTDEEAIDVVYPGEEEEEPEVPVDPDAGLPELICDAFATGVEYSLSEQDWPDNLNVKVSTPGKLKSLTATIIAGNGGFGGAVVDLGFENRELVGDDELGGILAAVGVNIPMPAKGVTSYDFPIGSFFAMMNIYGPTVDADQEDDEPDGKEEHVFLITVTDQNGKSASAELKVKIKK